MDAFLGVSNRNLLYHGVNWKRPMLLVAEHFWLIMFFVVVIIVCNIQTVSVEQDQVISYSFIN